MVAVKFPLRSKELEPRSKEGENQVKFCLNDSNLFLGKEFLATLEAYLDALEISGAPCLLIPVLPTLREGSNHKYYRLIVGRLRALASAVIGNSTYIAGGAGACKAVSTLCSTCMSHIFDDNQTLEVKQMLMDHLCFPLLRLCSSAQLTIIMSTTSGENSILSSSAEGISVIMQLGCTLQSEIPRDSESANALTFLQSCAFAIIEILYDKCSLYDLKNEIIQAYAGQVTSATQKELTQTICRTAHKLIRSELSSVIDLSNRCRLYAAAFSCVAIIVAKTQSDEKFFNSLVFDSKPEQSMWEHIVDTSTTYIFANRKFETVFVGCKLPGSDSQSGRRRKIRGGRTLADGLLSSSSIVNSQLTQDSGAAFRNLQQFRSRRQMSQLDSMDWTQDIERAVETSDAVDRVRFDIVCGDEHELVEGFDDQTIAIEMNDLNSQHIMPALLRIIQRMHTLFGDQWNSDPSILPKWLTVCKDLLVDGIHGSIGADKESKRNIRLFVLRLLLNQPVTAIAARYMQVLLPNIVECSLSDLISDKAPTSMNYFLRDVIFALCNSWSDCKPDIYSKALCWKFAAAIINTIYDDDSTIFKENLCAVNSLLRKWTDSDPQNGKHIASALNLGPLMDLLNTEMVMTGGAHSKSGSRGFDALRRRLSALEIFKQLMDCGIQASCLLNSAAAMTPLDNTRRPQKSNSFGSLTAGNPLMVSLLLCLDLPRKEIMEDAAGVVGCILCSLKQCEGVSSLASVGNITVQNLTSDITASLLSKMTSNKGWDIVAACLKSISEQDPSYLDRELFIKIHAWFRKMSVRAKYEYLSAISNSSLESFAADVIEHLVPSVGSLLSDISIVSIGKGAKMLRLPMIQINTLKLMRRLWRHINMSALTHIIASDVFGALVEEGSAVQTRVEAFEFLLEVSSQHSTLQLNHQTLQQIADSGDGASTTVAIQSRLVSLLLKGLCDPDSDGIDVDDMGKEPPGHFHLSTMSQSSPMPASSSTSSSAVSSLTQSSGSQRGTREPIKEERPVIRKRVYDYFMKVFGMSEHIIDRLYALMTSLFEPQRSSSWLNYSAHFLLSLANNTRQFSTVLFERPLAASAQFTSMNLNSSGTTTSSKASFQPVKLTPLFSLERKANSQLLTPIDQSFLFGNSLSQSTAFSQVGSGFIRGTQEYSWTQTQDTMMPEHRADILTGRKGALLSTQCVIAFPRTVTQDKTGVTASQTQNPTAGESKYAVVTQQLVSRRFKQISGVRSKPSFAYFKQDIMTFKTNQRQHQKRLMTYRSYRDGELPDIAIALSDIIKPLQLLSLRDSTVASNVISALFECSLQSSDVVAASATSVQSIFDAMNLLLRRLVVAGARNSQLVSFILNSVLFLSRQQSSIAADWPIFTVNPDTVGEAALKSLNIHGGIALLEQQLLSMTSRRQTSAQVYSRQSRVSNQKAQLLTQRITQVTDELDSGPPSVGQQFSQMQTENAQEMQFWHQLCRLYNGLGEKEIFMSLSSSLTANEDSRRALAAELDSDYSTAVKLYSELNEKCLIQKHRVLGMDIDKDEEAESPAHNDDFSLDNLSSLDKAQAIMDAWIDATPMETDLWNDRAIECLKQLCDWSGLENLLEKYVADDVDKSIDVNAVAANSGTRDRFFSPYITCLTMFDDQEHADKLYRVCQQVLLPSAGSSDVNQIEADNRAQLKTWLETRHSAELAVVYSRRKEWGRSRVYSNTTYAQFMVEWSGLHPCATQAKRNLLRNIQQIVEIEDISRNILSTNLENDSIPFMFTQSSTVLRKQNPVLAQLFEWCASEPSLNDPAFCWDAIINLRHTLKNSTEFSSKETEKLVLVHLADLHRAASVSAISQGNLNAAKMQLEKSGKLKKQAVGRADALSMTDVFAVCNYNNRSISRKMKQREVTDDELSSMFEKTLKLIDTKLGHSKPTSAKSVGVKMKLETAQAHVLKADWLEKYARFKKSKAGTADTQSRKLVLDATKHYISAEAASDPNVGEDGSSASTGSHFESFRTAMYGKFAKHYDALLTQMADSSHGHTRAEKRTRDDAVKTYDSNSEDIDGKTDSTSVASLLIKTYLKGLQYGSSYCRTHLLALLKVIGKYPDAVGNSWSMENISKMPASTLLPYAPQLMGILDLPEGPAAAALLEHIASIYPTALQYPFKITSEFLGAQGRLLSQKLGYILKNDSIDAFVEALYGISHPELRWNDGIKEMMKIYRELAPRQPTSSSNKSKEAAELNKKLQEYYLRLKSGTIASEWKFVGAKIGMYNRKWARTVQKVADDAVGVNGESILVLGKQALDLLHERTKAVSDTSKMKFIAGNAPLQEFSSWLAEFDHTLHPIEVPGQYFIGSETNCRGISEMKEMILSVDPRLLVMSSIRKPKRIRFYGSHGREYMFLVKGGEDLRNDERIQQLFMLMNSVVNTPENEFETLGKQSTLHTHAKCSADAEFFQARTYSVVPMTSKVGLLEWVKDTVPLKFIIGKEMAKDVGFAARNKRAVNDNRDNVDVSQVNAAAMRLKWVGSHGADDYHAMFRAKDKFSALKLYAEMKEELPDHFLRSYLLSMCSGPEAYLTLRSEFSKTLAVSSIFGYILGLGDRHLENLLLDNNTGGIVQIDFGICFGMGSSMLPVPELLPFRLSPQLISVLKPLDGHGLLNQYMSRCMRRIRADEGQETVANALEIYLNDPIVEWMKHPQMQREEMIQLNIQASVSQGEGGGFHDGGAIWEPRRRVGNAIKKMNGFHPGALLLDDLASNASVKAQKSFDALAVMINDACIVRSDPALGLISNPVDEEDGAGLNDSEVAVPVGPDSRKRRKVSQDSANLFGSETSSSHLVPSVTTSSSLKSRSGRGAKAAKTDKSCLASATLTATSLTGMQILSDLSARPPLEVSEQIEMLLSLATDPQLLVRQWQGLAAWV
jgi:DNA-binding transcriptional regulator YhcF (GntR family)